MVCQRVRTLTWKANRLSQDGGRHLPRSEIKSMRYARLCPTSLGSRATSAVLGQLGSARYENSCALNELSTNARLIRQNEQRIHRQRAITRDAATAPQPKDRFELGCNSQL